MLSRISGSGSLIAVGTRLSTKDLYLELRDDSRYPDEKSPWSYLAMPAVLEFAEDPVDWVTLWPKSNIPDLGARGDMAEADENGLYPKWDGLRLKKKRGRMTPRSWAMVYMQEQVSQEPAQEQEQVALEKLTVVQVVPRRQLAPRLDRSLSYCLRAWAGKK